MISTFALFLVFLLLPEPVFQNVGGVPDHMPLQPLTLPNAVTITWPLEATDLSVLVLMSSCWIVLNDFVQLLLCCIFILERCFTFSETKPIDTVEPINAVIGSSHNMKRRNFILLLLLFSGNVQPNPGPVLNNIRTPDEFNARTGLGLVLLNIRSLLPKIDAVKIWIKSTNADIFILSETCLSKAVYDREIAIDGYNVFWCDRP